MTAVKFTVINTLFWLGLHFGGSCLCRKLWPPGSYNPYSWWFAARSYEEKLYRLLKVKSWKDKLPEMGGLGGFSKDKLRQRDKAYYNLFVQETCLAEADHLLIAALGFLSLPLNGREELYWSLPVAVCIGLLQLPFVVIQRYNRPRLLKLCERAKDEGKNDRKELY